MSELSKEELTKQMNLKNREALLKSDGIASLFIYNLENFAYRYLETSTNKGIKCQVDGDRFWVESTEPNIVEALKWKNADLKKKLIEICKKYPGTQSKQIKVKLTLETTQVDKNNVECFSSIVCLDPNDSEETLVEKKTKMKFEDPIELRNKHAALLEEVSEVF